MLDNDILEMYCEFRNIVDKIDTLVEDGAVEKLGEPIVKIIEDIFRLGIESNIAELSAAQAWQKYQAYLKSGFSEEQAFKLLVRDMNTTSDIIKNMNFKEKSKK